jgi:hypothetical protein
MYNDTERKFIARIAFTGVLASLLYSFFAHTLLHQLQSPVLKYPYVDLTYWAFHWLGVPEFITAHYWVAVLFDTLLAGSCVMAMWKQRFWALLFAVLYFIYFIVFNTYGAHHTNHKIGMLLIAVPFIVRDIVSFNLLWEGLRYFLLFSYSSSFLWKLFRMSWWHPDQGLLIMRKNFLHDVDGLHTWLLSHPQLVNVFFSAGFLLEGLFIAGFFTKRFDKGLLIVSILLVIGFWLMADAHFFELLILSLTLVNFKALMRLTRPAGFVPG